MSKDNNHAYGNFSQNQFPSKSLMGKSLNAKLQVNFGWYKHTLNGLPARVYANILYSICLIMHLPSLNQKCGWHHLDAQKSPKGLKVSPNHC